MRNRNKTETSQQDSGNIDTDVDRFLPVNLALRRLIQDESVPDIEAELIEVRPQANGDVAWRITPPRADESEVGLVTNS